MEFHTPGYLIIFLKKNMVCNEGTHDVSGEEHRGSRLELIAFQAQILLDAVKATIADI